MHSLPHSNGPAPEMALLPTLACVRKKYNPDALRAPSGGRNGMRVVRYRLAAALAACAAMWPVLAPAQEQYPNREIKIIVPFPAGGGTDITGRLLGEQLRKILGQSVVIDNRAGARWSSTTALVRAA